MDTSYWKGKWEIGDIGFHQPQVQPHLVRFFSRIPPGTVLVPLCGKTNDMKWFLDQGWSVVGAEVSPIACRSFFEEHQIPYEEEPQGEFTVFRGGQATLWCGDFFKLPTAAAASVTAYCDRAALIALPGDLRPKYAEKVKSLLGFDRTDSIRGLLLALEYPEGLTHGPPFSVTTVEVHRLYGGFFRIQSLSREEVTEPRAVKSERFDGVPLTDTSYSLERTSRAE